MAADDKQQRQKLSTLTDLEHNLTKAIDRVKSDVTASNDRSQRQLREMNEMIACSMRDIASHKVEIDGILRHMRENAETYLKDTEQQICNNLIK